VSTEDEPADAPPERKLFRLELTYTGLALIAPSGTVATYYHPILERKRAEMDRDRLNARPAVPREDDQAGV